MRSIVFLILNFLLLAVAFATGIFLFMWVAAALAIVIIYLLIRQKLTGRKFASMHVYTFRHTEKSHPQVIDAEYREIDEQH